MQTKVVHTTIILFFITLCSTYAGQKFEKGILDLREISTEEWRNVSLNGEWEFYWNQLLMHHDFNDSIDSTPVFIEVPSDWKKQKTNNVTTSGTGYATYRSKILIDSTDKELAFFFSNLGTASELYVNGKLIYQAGVVGITQESSEPGYRPGVFSFFPDGDTLELILHVSNFDYARGGFWNNKAYFGIANRLQHDYANKVLISSLVVGGMIFFMIYLLFHYFLDLRFRYSLYFSLVCLFIALRVVVVDEIILLNFFPNLGWNWLVKLEYLTLPAGILTLNLFIYKFFPDEFKKIFIKPIGIVGVLFSLFIVASPTLIFTKYLFLYQLYVLLASIFDIYVIIRAVSNKRDGSVKFLIASSVLLIVFINDILYTNEVINTAYYTTWGSVIFITVLAQMLASRYRLLFKQSEKLTEKLEFLNCDLEARVIDRTSQIEQQNKLLRQKNQEIEKINQTKDKFYAIIAHDLRNPISAIFQLTETIADRDNQFSEEERQCYVENISQSAKETYDLLENLLKWATWQQGNLQLTPTTVFLSSIIERCILLFRSNANYKNITIETPSGIDCNAYADKEMATVIIRNLLHNAIKFSPENGTVVFGIELINDYWKISVTDNGIGIDKCDLDKLFKPRDKNKDIGNSKQKGMGLGLVLCKEFVELNQGQIWVESVPNKETTFYFTLPKQE